MAATLIASGVQGCAHTQDPVVESASLEPRAREDLQCPEEPITRRQVGHPRDRTMLASGCGRSTLYHAVCVSAGTTPDGRPKVFCDWELVVFTTL